MIYRQEYGSSYATKVVAGEMPGTFVLLGRKCLRYAHAVKAVAPDGDRFGVPYAKDQPDGLFTHFQMEQVEPPEWWTRTEAEAKALCAEQDKLAGYDPTAVG